MAPSSPTRCSCSSSIASLHRPPPSCRTCKSITSIHPASFFFPSRIQQSVLFPACSSPPSRASVVVPFSPSGILAIVFQPVLVLAAFGMRAFATCNCSLTSACSSCFRKCSTPVNHRLDHDFSSINHVFLLYNGQSRFHAACFLHGCENFWESLLVKQT
jgi:hypothetical protein